VIPVSKKIPATQPRYLHVRPPDIDYESEARKPRLNFCVEIANHPKVGIPGGENPRTLGLIERNRYWFWNGQRKSNGRKCDSVICPNFPDSSYSILDYDLRLGRTDPRKIDHLGISRSSELLGASGVSPQSFKVGCNL
jgi:hypothetical protein